MKKVVILLILLLFAGAVPALGGSVQTMDKAELKELLGSPDVVVLDVRTGRDWSSSEFKIKGAVRLEKSDIDSAIADYDKGKTIVLYCA